MLSQNRSHFSGDMVLNGMVSRISIRFSALLSPFGKPIGYSSVNIALNCFSPNTRTSFPVFTR